MVSSDEMETTAAEQPIAGGESDAIPFESLHEGSLVVRFEQNARTVSITWLPDDLDAPPTRERYALGGGPFDGECFPRCYQECKNGGGSALLCVLLCLAQCRGGND